MADSLPEYDNRPGVFIAHEMPDNLKIAPLSDAAFRTLIKALCYCSRVKTDGRIPQDVWDAMGPPKARKELMAPPVMAPDKAPPIEKAPGGVLVHDYLLHNRSAEEARLATKAKSQSGSLGAHTRWHVLRRKVDDSCPYCQEAADA